MKGHYRENTRLFGRKDRSLRATWHFEMSSRKAVDRLNCPSSEPAGAIFMSRFKLLSKDQATALSTFNARNVTHLFGYFFMPKSTQVLPL